MALGPVLAVAERMRAAGWLLALGLMALGLTAGPGLTAIPLPVAAIVGLTTACSDIPQCSELAAVCTLRQLGLWTGCLGRT